MAFLNQNRRFRFENSILFHACRYGYSWKVAEAEKNLLRTHTTAVSSRMLYKLAQERFKPAKYFSIDRVFRNEAVDRTHLAEFHQIEGKLLLALPCSCILLPGGRDFGQSGVSRLLFNIFFEVKACSAGLSGLLL